MTLPSMWATTLVPVSLGILWPAIVAAAPVGLGILWPAIVATAPVGLGILWPAIVAVAPVSLGTVRVPKISSLTLFILSWWLRSCWGGVISLIHGGGAIPFGCGILWPLIINFAFFGWGIPCPSHFFLKRSLNIFNFLLQLLFHLLHFIRWLFCVNWQQILFFQIFNG